MARLRADANVTINDPVLSEQFAAMEQAMRAQQSATQPGTATTAPNLPAIPAPATAPAAAPAGRTNR